MRSAAAFVCRRGLARFASSAPAVAGARQGVALWQSIDITDRERFRSLARSAPASPSALTDIRGQVTSQDKNIAKAKDKKRLYWEQDFATLTDVVTFYENLMQPLHENKATRYAKWVMKCDLWSKIAQTKDAAQSDLDAWKAEHEKLGNEIAELEKTKQAYVDATFDTAMMNHVLGMLRLAAETNEGAHAMALQVFHDMTENEIAFDDATKIMLRNVCFGDSYYDNSDLFMSHVEYPERGEHTLGKSEDLTEVSATILKVIGDRHKIDVRGSGVTLRDKEQLLRPEFKSKEMIEE